VAPVKPLLLRLEATALEKAAESALMRFTPALTVVALARLTVTDIRAPMAEGEDT
jgi:hypothetical protein